MCIILSRNLFILIISKSSYKGPHCLSQTTYYNSIALSWSGYHLKEEKERKKKHDKEYDILLFSKKQSTHKFKHPNYRFIRSTISKSPDHKWSHTLPMSRKEAIHTIYITILLMAVVPKPQSSYFIKKKTSVTRMLNCFIKFRCCTKCGKRGKGKFYVLVRMRKKIWWYSTAISCNHIPGHMMEVRQNIFLEDVELVSVTNFLDVGSSLE